VKETETQTSKKEGKESKNQDETRSMRDVLQRKLWSTWSEMVRKKVK
jgi:hypothetical protein